MQVLRAADRTASPWKNGGGFTWSVAASPPGSGVDDFDWRISIADVGASGPFSVFPGVDRVLTVIEGRGLILDVGGLRMELDAASPSVSFAGDEACHARLSEGPIRDLNVMTRRGVHDARCRRMHGPAIVACEAEHTVILALTPLEIEDIRLAPEDAVLASPGCAVALGQGTFLVLEIRRT